MYFICHFLPGKILPGKNLKTLFFIKYYLNRNLKSVAGIPASDK